MGDFGISKIVATTAISTAHYLSPDICRGQPESESDLRSLGTIIKLSTLWGKTEVLVFADLKKFHQVVQCQQLPDKREEGEGVQHGGAMQAYQPKGNKFCIENSPQNIV